MAKKPTEARRDREPRSVLLTGATGGIGSELARQLAARGDRLLLVARKRAALDALAAELQRSHGADVDVFAGDIAEPADRAALVTRAEQRQVDTLINNAAQPGFGAIDAIDDATIARVLTVNLVAPLQLTRAMIAPLSRRPAATILNMGSALGHIGVPGFAIYCATKFGLRGATEALRRELAESSIRVVSISPRTTRTSFNDEATERFNQATGTASDTPQAVVRAVVRQLDGRAIDRVLGFPEKLFAKINALVPGMVDGGFGRHRRALADLRHGAPAPAERAALDS
ncbi:MAG: SDR family oxidoreductase [Burkholderiaceae bacterium]